jgi:hypothetical protein
MRLLEGAVVDGFGLLDLAEGPREDPLGRGKRDLDLVEDLGRGGRVERVVGQFLVHVFPSKYGLEGARGHGSWLETVPARVFIENP